MNNYANQLHKIYSHIFNIQNVTYEAEMTVLWSWFKGSCVRENEMAEMTLGTNSRNNPGI
jgi:hypothetical protein